MDETLEALDAEPLEDCPICGADIGPSASFVWHLEDEDCRAVRLPIERAA